MVGQRLGAGGCESEVEEHEDVLILRKAKVLTEVVYVDAVEPAAVHAGIGGSEHEVGGYDGGIFYAGLAGVGLRSTGGWIGVDVILVIGYHEHGWGAIAAGGVLVYDCECLGALCYIDVLFLQVLGGGCHAAGLQDGGELLLGELAGAVILLA